MARLQRRDAQDLAGGRQELTPVLWKTMSGSLGVQKIDSISENNECPFHPGPQAGERGGDPSSRWVSCRKLLQSFWVRS